MTQQGEAGAVIGADLARCLLMDGAGLLEDPMRRTGPKTLARTVRQLGFVQIDSINMIERAHHLTLHTRFHGYRRSHLRQLVERDRALFEHWTHDSSLIPTEHFGHWKGRFARFAPGKWFKQRTGKDGERVCDAIRQRLERDGPLRSRDLNERTKERNEKWWGWSPTKAALELLWRRGEVLITRRDRFEKVYDLTHRVLPDHHDIPEPAREETIQWACRTALDRLGCATASEVAKFWNDISLSEARIWLQDAARRGEVMPVEIASENAGPSKPGFAVADWEQRVKRAKRAPESMRLLCPFDPVIRDRDRLERLFGFRYRFEAFVPEVKRQYGYYVLPILQGDRLVGRVDAKTHRARSVLEIKGLWWERGQGDKQQAKELESAAARLAEFVGASSIDWPLKKQVRGR